MNRTHSAVLALVLIFLFLPLKLVCQSSHCAFSWFGYIDRTGTFVVKPQFDMAYSFHEGLAAIENCNGSAGYIDHSGKQIFTSGDAADFSEGLARVGLVKPTSSIVEGQGQPNLPSGRYGFIDKQGNLVIDATWLIADHFSDGLANVGSVGKQGYVDKSGKVVIPNTLYMAYDFNDGLARVAVERKDGSGSETWGYINKKGQFVIHPRYEDAGDFSEGLASVKMNGKWGYIDETGRMVIQPRFDEAWEFREEVGRVVQNGMCGDIKKGGEFAVKPQPEFFICGDFHEGLASVEREKAGYIDKSGNYVIKPVFDKAEDFSEGLAFAALGETRGYIDKNGEFVFTGQFINAWEFSEGLAAVSVDKEP